MITKVFWIFIFITGCSSTQKKEDVARAIESWNGQDASALESHDYFKTLRKQKISHDDGIENWIFRDQTRFQTSAYCDSLGGCMGLPTYNCDYAFSVQNGKVIGGSRTGSCPSPKVMKFKK